MHYCFIVNNEPGKAGNADKIRADIEKLPEPIDFEIYLTTAQKTAIDHVRDYCKANPDQETCFVACGGDGTINEVATGMVGAKNKHLAVLAYGSGNDLIKLIIPPAASAPAPIYLIYVLQIPLAPLSANISPIETVPG